MDLPELSRHLVPADASAAESQLFVGDLMTVLETVSPRPQPQPQAVDEEEWRPQQIRQRIA